MQTLLSSHIQSHCIYPLPQLSRDPLAGHVTACLPSAETPVWLQSPCARRRPTWSELCLHTGGHVGHQGVRLEPLARPLE